MRTDNKGGMNISKSAITLMGILLIVCTTFASVIAFSIGVRGDVDTNKDIINDCKVNMINLDDRVGENEKTLICVSTQIADMKEDLSEIKSDVKLLLNQGDN